MNKRISSTMALFFLFPLSTPSFYLNDFQIISPKVKSAVLEEKVTSAKLDNIVKEISLISKIKQNKGSKKFTDFYIKVNKKELNFELFQKYKGKDFLLLKKSVSLGMKGFSTPSGRFYINRIINYPIWYPLKSGQM